VFSCLAVAESQEVHARSGPLLGALRDAIGSDPELEVLWREIEAARLAGQGRFAGRLADGGVLGHGLSAEEARDIIWTLCSFAVHEMLVLERGWTVSRYETWLVATLDRALLAPTAPPER
jgi:hypothetical protein